MSNNDPATTNPTRLEKDSSGPGLTLIAGDDSTGDTIRSMSDSEIEQTLKSMLEALRVQDVKEKE